MAKRQQSPTAQPSQHHGFLSYTRIDDEFFGGGITALRQTLELGVKVVSGNREFSIFQDIEGIELGEKWQERLDEALVATRVLIPVVTPLFFQSPACRDELGKFIDHERSLRRADLILPIYYHTTPLLEDRELLDGDALASQLLTRQRYDWRQLSPLPMTDPKIRPAAIDLCTQIASAIARKPVSPRDDRAKSRSAALEKAFTAVAKTAQPKAVVRGRKLVLWVDDNPDNNAAERDAMNAYSIDFAVARSTDAAMAHIGRFPFDAVISDMARPRDERAGFTLLRWLRSRDQTTPYFIYSGYRDAVHVDEALQLGAQGLTNVPSELIDGLLRALDQRRTARASAARTASKRPARKRSRKSRGAS